MFFKLFIFSFIELCFAVLKDYFTYSDWGHSLSGLKAEVVGKHVLEFLMYSRAPWSIRVRVQVIRTQPLYPGSFSSVTLARKGVGGRKSTTSNVIYQNFCHTL